MNIEELENLLNDKDIIYQDSFFEQLKCTSLLDFRRNINMVQDKCPSLLLEEKVDKYYEELLNEYDDNSKLFMVYNKALECFKSGNFSFLQDYREFNYFIDPKMLIRLNDYHGDGWKRAYDYLAKSTSQKISEIVVDGLFKDTIYNVWINIREILRYHDSLSDNEKMISKDRLDLYRTILDIDKINNKDKIKLYHELKDKRIALTFYEDWSLLKKHSYEKLKNSLFKVTTNEKLLNEEESKKYKVPVYELNGEDFYMLISCRDSYSDTSRIRRHCYSLISGYNMEVYARNKYIYGYTDFDIGNIMHVFETDAYSDCDFRSNSFTTRYVNRIMKPNQISDSTNYSEIQIANKWLESLNKYATIKPSYLIAFDRINERYAKEAERLNIPIVKINTSKYLNKIKECYDKKIDLGFKAYEIINDDYTKNSYLEEERKMRR